MTSVSPTDFAPVGLVNRDAGAIFVRTDAPWRTLARPRAGDPRRPRAGCARRGRPRPGSGTSALAGLALGGGAQAHRRDLGLDRGLRAVAAGADGRRRRPRVVQPARSAGAALGRAHPQPGRDGGRAAAAVPGRADVPGAGHRLDARDAARAGRAEGHAARARAHPRRRGQARRRGRRVPGGAGAAPASRPPTRIPAAVRRYARARPTGASARSCTARRFAASEAKQFGAMFFPTRARRSRSSWCRRRSWLTSRKRRRAAAASERGPSPRPGRARGGSPRSLALDRRLPGSGGDPRLRPDRGRAAARLPAAARHAGARRRPAGRAARARSPTTSSRWSCASRCRAACWAGDVMRDARGRARPGLRSRRCWRDRRRRRLRHAVRLDPRPVRHDGRGADRAADLFPVAARPRWRRSSRSRPARSRRATSRARSCASRARPRPPPTRTTSTSSRSAASTSARSASASCSA